MVCSKCGKEIEKDGQFCKFCGTKIGKKDEGKTEKIQAISDEVNEIEEIRINKQFKNTSKKRIIIIGFVLITILLIVKLLVYNDPENKYLSLVKEGQTAEATELYNSKIKGDQNRVNEIKEKCVEEIQEIEAAYLSGKTDYKTTLAQLSKYSGILSDATEFTEIEKDIYSIQNSRTAYSKAVEYEKSSDIPNAMIQYSKVIEKDSDFTNALKKLTELKDIYRSVIIEEVENLTQNNKFVEAIAKIDNALLILDADTELGAKKKTLLAKQEEVNIANKAAAEALKVATEAAEKERIRLYADKQITKSGLEIIYKTAKLTTKITEDNTSGAYIYYYCENDEIYFDIMFKVKNISNYSVNIDSIFDNINVTYNTTYKYNKFECFYSTADDVSIIYGMTNIEPLKTVTYHLTVKLPREVADSSSPISISFNTFGEKQFLQFR